MKRGTFYVAPAAPVKLDHELEQSAGLLNASQSLNLAGLFERWAGQLKVKAAALGAHSQPGFTDVSPKGPQRNRQSKNWLRVNIGDREAKELRALAECFGVEFGQFLKAAIRSHARDEARRLGFESLGDVVKMRRKCRANMGVRLWKMWRAIGHDCNQGRN